MELILKINSLDIVRGLNIYNKKRHIIGYCYMGFLILLGVVLMIVEYSLELEDKSGYIVVVLGIIMMLTLILLNNKNNRINKKRWEYANGVEGEHLFSLEDNGISQINLKSNNKFSFEYKDIKKVIIRNNYIVICNHLKQLMILPVFNLEKEQINNIRDVLKEHNINVNIK